MTEVVNFIDLEAQLKVERQKVDVASHDFSVRELVFCAGSSLEKSRE